MNPWTNLPESSPYVLAADEPFVAAYNAFRKEDSDSWVNLELPPEPWLGPMDAPVLILQANASYDRSTESALKDPAVIQQFLESARNWTLPHLSLARSERWWRQTTKQLVKACGGDPLRVARAICSIEFFPYRSLRFDQAHLRLPSQAFTFAFVDEAVRRGTLVLVMRCKSQWLGAVPILQSSPFGNVHFAKNPQRAFISRDNFDGGVFDTVVAKVNEWIDASRREGAPTLAP